MLLAWGVIAVVLLTFFVAFFVIKWGKRTVSNLTFALLTLLVGVWICLNYASIQYSYSAKAELYLRADFIIAVAMLLVFWHYSLQMAAQAKRRQLRIALKSKDVVVISVACGIAMILPALPQFVTVTEGAVEAEYSYGVLFTGYVTVVIGVVALALLNFGSAYRHAKGKFKRQIKLMLIGLTTAAVALSVSNLIVPLLTDSRVVNNAAGYTGYLGVVAFLIATAFAVVRHGLFEPRRILARTVAYLCTFAFFLILYALASVTILSPFIGRSMDYRQDLSYVFIAIFSGLTFQPIKMFFDRVTDRIFFKSTYDSDKVLEQFGEVIAKELEIGTLLETTARFIAVTLKAEFVTVISLDESMNLQNRAIYGHTKAPVEELLRGAITDIMSGPITYMDSVEDSNPALYRRMRRLNAAIMIRLESPAGMAGFIVIGDKQSGESFNSTDINLLSVMSDELAIAVQNSLRFQQIQQFNATLQRNIDEATSELRRNNKKLQALDAVKDEFISMASHQLRTPLTSIKGYLSMVLEGDAGELNPMQRKFLQEAYNSSQRMVFLIGDFLNVSRLNTGKFIIEHNRTNLADMVSEEVDQLRPSAEARQLKLEYHKPSHFPLQSLDENKLRQVVMNFMDNAIYYSKPGGTIKVELTRDAKEITLKVKDQGIGVPASQRHHLFEKFYRATNAQQARPDGSGIGLFLAKKVIVAHRGSIIFESEEGKGSTFGFKIPLMPFDESDPLPLTAEAEKQKIPA